MLGVLKRIKEKFFSKRPPTGEIAFRSVFTRFRELLDNNNRALEIIVDMEEKLSGDYIFDKAYIINSYNELADTVYKVIYNLNITSSNKYIKLYERFENINTQLRALIEGKTYTLTEDLVIPIEDLNEAIADIVGNKAARLGEVRNKLNYPIPDGFAITITAYKRFLDYNELSERIEELLKRWDTEGEENTEEIANEIRSLFIKAELPPDLKVEMEKAIHKIARHKNVLFALVSSAVGEDSEYSFAGQFESELNVPKDESFNAYKKVLASLFSPRAMTYAYHKGFSPLELPMAVLCVEMIAASVSGVIYTIDPTDPSSNTLLINANWGLGKTVVEGSVSLDRFKISRDPPYPIMEKKISSKKRMLLAQPGGGTIETEAPASPCLTEEQIKELVEMALNIERYFKKPQDIEWSYDQKGKLYILQTRPLQGITQPSNTSVGLSVLRDKYRVLLEKKGVIAQRGIAVGRVFIAETDENVANFAQGEVLVTRKTSPLFGRIMHKVAAIITDIGSPTGHMASLAREFRVPAIVDTGIATQVLKNGIEVTVDAEENVIYEGIVKELLDYYLTKEIPFKDTREYRLLKQILSRVAPLNLTDPNDPNFNPEGCHSFHDILRFAHEKAVAEVIELHIDKTAWENVPAKKLKTQIPLDLVLIDLGGGLSPEAEKNTSISPQDITSLPMLALWKGLSVPGVWLTEPVSVTMTSTLQGLSTAPRYLGVNLAVVSREYLNLSLRLGYHFNMVDTYMSDNMVDNYIYFRFLGGVTEITRRTRRAQLLSKILGTYDFKVDTKADLVVARIREIGKKDVEGRLEMIGRLIGFTRQLDVMLKSDKAIDYYVGQFLSDKWQQHLKMEQQKND